MTVVVDGTSGITTNSGTVVSTTDATLNGLTVGRGGGAVSTATAVGSGALATTNTGTYISAFGTNALNSNTSGGYNTAIGAASLYNNSTGSYNTGIGMWALQANTTASDNTAVGYQAGYSNTTGTRNAYLGNGAGYSNSTNNANTGVGWGSLNANTAAHNTGFGYQSLYNNTTGTFNTALGDAALLSNTTGFNNTAVGYQAGYSITTQSYNIYIGYGCGSAQTGAGNVLLGASSFSGYNGNDQVAIKVGNSGREALYADIGGGGSFRQYSNSATWAVTSDQRVKENIVEITNGLEKIVALRPVTFDYITSKEHNAGFIAQDFQTVLPDQVKKVKARPEEAELVGEDEIYSIQQNLVPYLVNAIKDLKTIVDAQAAEIAELKAKVA
jgi:hypothetical protein